jgi:hypothetical protein
VITLVTRYYSSVAPETTLTGTINAAATSITVGSTVGFPALFPYTLALDYEGLTEELVQVNSAVGLSLTVTRAIDGTSATSHNAGARVRHVSSARDFADSRTHENSDQQVHGLGPGEEIVGTEKVQTLENKTLLSPAFSGSFTGTLRGGSAATDKFRLDNVTDVSPSSLNHAFQIGLDGGTNLRMDNAEIMAANNGANSTLIVQADGGLTSFNSAGGSDSVADAVFVNGTTESNAYRSSRTAATSNSLTFKASADTQFRFITRADGQMSWGPGGVTAPDATLSRTSAGTMTLASNLTVTNDLLANNIRAGRAVLSAGPANSTVTLAVSFIPAMTGAPSVVITPDSAADQGSDQIRWTVNNITSSGFTIRSWRVGSSATAYSWQATLNTQ